jgi:hypothetical protein
MFANSSFYAHYLSIYSQKYIFSIRNPYDFESGVSTKLDMENDEIKKDNYLTVEDKKKKNITDYIIQPIKSYKQIKDTYQKVLFRFTSYVSIIEKTKNILLWTDPLLSLYFFIVIFVASLVIYSIRFKYLMLFVITKKFIFGAFYYKKKLTNNVEVANIILEHTYYKWVTEKKRNESIDGTDIDLQPITDEKFRILIKEELEKNADIHIKSEFLNSVVTIGEVKSAIMKCKALLKIKKESKLYKNTLDNKNIYQMSVEIEEIFYYYVKNVKSDYYISKNYKYEQEEVSPDSPRPNGVKNDIK